MLRVGYIFLLLLQSQVEAGGVPALAARGVPEQMEIKVPSDKVGVIIGRGGETIKNMQTKSRARIQVITSI
jgi:far upstream element-binding protein